MNQTIMDNGEVRVPKRGKMARCKNCGHLFAAKQMGQVKCKKCNRKTPARMARRKFSALCDQIEEKMYEVQCLRTQLFLLDAEHKIMAEHPVNCKCMAHFMVSTGRWQLQLIPTDSPRKAYDPLADANRDVPCQTVTVNLPYTSQSLLEPVPPKPKPELSTINCQFGDGPKAGERMTNEEILRYCTAADSARKTKARTRKIRIPQIPYVYPEPASGHCVVCSAELSGRQTRFCSEAHRTIYLDMTSPWRTIEWTEFSQAVIEMGGRCFICGATEGFLSVDHIKPVGEGGKEFDAGNCRIICQKCKNDRMVEEAK